MDKWCTLGQHYVDRSRFGANRTKADGLSNICADCNRNRSRQYHHDVRREQRTNMSASTYDDLYKQQQGKCASCGVQSNNLCADHDHITGRTRKLLCPNCNKALGLLNDNPERVLSLYTYISEFRS